MAKPKKKYTYSLLRMLETAEHMTVTTRRMTVAIVIYKPGQPGRKTADSTSTIRFLDEYEDGLIFELSKSREERQR